MREKEGMPARPCSEEHVPCHSIRGVPVKASPWTISASIYDRRSIISQYVKEHCHSTLTWMPRECPCLLHGCSLRENESSIDPADIGRESASCDPPTMRRWVGKARSSKPQNKRYPERTRLSLSWGWTDQLLRLLEQWDYAPAGPGASDASLY